MINKFKISVLLLLLLCIISNSLSAMELDDPADGYMFMDDVNPTKISKKEGYAPAGGVFTPKGEIKALVIFAGFLNSDGSLWGSGGDKWDADKDFPNYVYNDTCSNGFSNFILSNSSSLDSCAEDNQSLTKYYSEMSNGKFTFLADLYPTRIDVDPSACNSWSSINRLVINTMKKDDNDPHFDWSPYDKRKNCPDYKPENAYDPESSDTPDKKPDYVFIIYRYKKGISNPPVATMDNWSASGGGSSTLGGLANLTYNGYEFNAGFTYAAGLYGNIAISRSMITHEIAHELYEAPHYFSCNNTVGKNFYNSYGWGMMTTEVYNTANAWERWYLGWCDFKTGGNSGSGEIFNLDNSTQNGNYTIRDFAKTGEAIRIKLPYVESQYLWLEYHSGDSNFDKRLIYQEDRDDNPIPQAGAGLTAYVEKMDDTRDGKLVNFSANCNDLKILHADGNYDFNNPTEYETLANYWWNIAYHFEKDQANPYGAHNLSSNIRNDYYTYSSEWDKKEDHPTPNPNSIIDYGTGPNSPSPKNEMIGVLKIVENGQDKLIWGNYGIDLPFTEINDKVGISTNPAVCNIQGFNTANQKLDPIYLNGISFKILNYGTDGETPTITVNVKFNDYNIENDLRMCGDIVAPPKEIIVKAGKTLRLDKSGTPMRTTLSAAGDFINPTTLKIPAGGTLSLESQATVRVENGSSLIFEENSKLDIAVGAKVVVEEGSKLIINGNDFQVNGKIIISDKGCLQISDYKKLEVVYRGELALQAGAIVELGRNTNINVGIFGDLSATGTRDKRVIFDYTPSYGTWKGITAASGSSIALKYASIENAKRAITAEFAVCKLNNVEVTKCNYGFMLVNCRNSYISYCKLTGINSTGSGILLQHTNCTIRGNKISRYSTGFEVFSSSPNVYTNKIYNNTIGLRITGNNSRPNLMLDQNPNVFSYKNNEIYENSHSQIYIGKTGSIYLSYGKNNIPANSSANGKTGFALYYKKTIDSTVPSRKIAARYNYWGFGSNFEQNKYKIFYPAPATSWLTYSNYATRPFSGIAPNPIDKRAKLLIKADTQSSNGEYAEAINSYSTLVAEYPATEEAYLALTKLPENYVKAISNKSGINLDLAKLEMLYKEKADDERWSKPKFFNEMVFKTKLLQESYEGAKDIAEEMLAVADNEEEKLLAQIDIAIAQSKIESKNGNTANTDSMIDKIEELSELVAGFVKPTGINDEQKQILPETFALYQNYPNPFNPQTTIKFALPQASAVKVNIYNARGGKIAEVVNGYKNAGYHTVKFDGSKFTSGIYFYSLEVGGAIISKKKMMLVK